MGSVQRGHGQARGEDRLNMTRQGEYSNTKDDLDEQNLAGAGYEKKKKKRKKEKIYKKRLPSRWLCDQFKSNQGSKY